MACLSLLRIRHALATCAAGLMLALPGGHDARLATVALAVERALRTR